MNIPKPYPDLASGDTQKHHNSDYFHYAIDIIGAIMPDGTLLPNKAAEFIAGILVVGGLGGVGLMRLSKQSIGE